MVAIPEHLVGDGPCQRCGGDNVRWWTERAFWNNVMAEWRNEDPTGGDPGGIYCIPCFVIIVDTLGYDVPTWEFKPTWRWQRK